MIVQSNNENNGTNKGSPGHTSSFFTQVQIIQFFLAEAEPLCEAATDITHHVGEANQGKDHHADGVTTCEACGSLRAKQILHEFGGGNFLDSEFLFPPTVYGTHRISKEISGYAYLLLHYQFTDYSYINLYIHCQGLQSQLNPNWIPSTIPPIACG